MRSESSVRPVAGGAGGSRHGRLRNVLQQLVLLTGMALTLGVVAWLVFGLQGVAGVLTCALVVGLLRPRVPMAWVLWMYDAAPLPRWAAPQLHAMVDVLAERAGLHRTPELYYIASAVPNAFVLGPRDDAALAVTDGALRLLNGREVAGVLAHEVSHLRNGDTSIMSLSDLVARLAQWMAWVGLWSLLVTVPIALGTGDVRPLLMVLVLLLVPTVVTLSELAFSRAREYDADRDAAALTGDPLGLEQALIVLDHSEGPLWERILVGRPGPDPLLLQTHPATEQRVLRLRALEARPRPSPLGTPHRATPSGYPPVTHRPRLRRTGVRW